MKIKKLIIIPCLLMPISTFAETETCKREDSFFSCLVKLPKIGLETLVEVFTSDEAKQAGITVINAHTISLTGGLGKKALLKTGNSSWDKATAEASDIVWEAHKGIPSKTLGTSPNLGKPIIGVPVDRMVEYIGERIRGQNEREKQEILDEISKIKDRIDAGINGYNDVFISKSSLDTLINVANFAHKEKSRTTQNKNFNILQTNSNKILDGTSHFGINILKIKNSRQTVQENPYLAKGSAIIEAPADIVLNWGNRPADLDSHLTGPINAQSSERFHVNYQNKGSLNSNPNVLLYRDDTSHGANSRNRPEQTRINVTQPGVYNFYVHDFSNKGSPSSRALSNSGAVVSVHTAGNRNLPEGDNLGRKVTQFTVPKDKIGTVWHTFELDTRRNTIKPVNTFHNDTKVIK